MVAVLQDTASGGRGIALITGGTSGIGRAVVDACAAAGWTVVGVDVNAAAIEECRKEYADRASRIHFLELDVSDGSAVERVVETVEREIGAITGLVNSAGIGRDIPFLQTKLDDFRRIVEINLFGSFLVAQQVARRMVERQRGSIVNIASVSGVAGNAGRVAYGASKGAVITMTKVIAVELAGQGVRINAVAPGPVETAMVREMHTVETRQQWLDRVPQRRYAKPPEIADTVVFLLDEDQASYITGQTICVDGGFTIGGIL